MAARRKRAEEHEEHVNHERWLVSYADMITLLMVLFVVLFAIGQTDLKKFSQLKHSLNNSLGGTSKVLQGGDGALDGQQSVVAHVDAPYLSEQARQALAEKQQAQAAQAAEQNTLQQAQHQIASALAARGLKDAVSFRLEGRGLVVTVVTDRVLFDTGSADLRPEGQGVLDAVASALLNLPNPIAVEGHTDNQPIAGGPYPTNWELSTARATSVLRYLIGAYHLDPKRMSAAGYADQRPLVPNDTDAHRAENRRVEVVVLNNTDSGGR